MALVGRPSGQHAAGLDEVRERFANAEPPWLVALFALELDPASPSSMAFRGVFCSGLGWRFSYEIGMAEQGTNMLLPAGGVGGLRSAPGRCARAA